MKSAADVETATVPADVPSPTVMFILKELESRDAQLPCVMLGFGPGLNVEMALLR